MHEVVAANAGNATWPLRHSPHVAAGASVFSGSSLDDCLKLQRTDYGGDVPTQRVAAVCLGRLVMDQDHEDTIALRNQPVQGKKYESEDGQAARHDRGGAGSVARARATAVDCRRLERSAAAGRLTAPLWQAAGRQERRRCAEQAQTSLWGTGDRLAITDGAISMSADDQSGRIRRQQQARTRFRPLDIGFGQSL